MSERLKARLQCLNASAGGALGWKNLWNLAADGDLKTMKRLPRSELVAGVNGTDHVQKTALHYAAYAGRADVCEFLQQCGAAIDVADARGKTPPDLARERRHAEVARQMESFEARKGYRDGYREVARLQRERDEREAGALWRKVEAWRREEEAAAEELLLEEHAAANRRRSSRDRDRREGGGGGSGRGGGRPRSRSRSRSRGKLETVRQKAANEGAEGGGKEAREVARLQRKRDEREAGEQKKRPKNTKKHGSPLVDSLLSSLLTNFTLLMLLACILPQAQELPAPYDVVANVCVGAMCLHYYFWRTICVCGVFSYLYINKL